MRISKAFVTFYTQIFKEVLLQKCARNYSVFFIKMCVFFPQFAIKNIVKDKKTKNDNFSFAKNKRSTKA